MCPEREREGKNNLQSVDYITFCCSESFQFCVAVIKTVYLTETTLVRSARLSPHDVLLF